MNSTDWEITGGYWTLSLMDERGKDLIQLSKGVSLNWTSGTNFALLKYLDPYGNTYFNNYHMNDLILELQTLKLFKGNDAAIIDEIISLANQCKNGVHTYIKFCGD